MKKIPQAVAMILLASALSCPMCSEAQVVQEPSGAKKGVMQTRGAVEIEALLHEFLAKVNEPQMHQRFWADDLIYVGAGGKVRTKAEIVKSVTEGFEKAQAEGKKDEGSFDAEDIHVRQYGEVCVLNFRLVAIDEKGAKTYYRNSGVFTKHGGNWQVDSWQATKEAEQK